MVKISNQDLEVSRELFFRLYDVYKKDGLSNKDAYNASCDYFDAEGYRVKYTTFESFKTVLQRFGKR